MAAEQIPVHSAAVAAVRPAGQIVELLAVALRHHRSGELAEAEVRYREILAIDPNHADTLHLLGVVALQMGRYDQAADLIGRAIASNDRVPAFHNNIGSALRASGRTQDAVAHYTRAISLKPDFAEAYANLGDVLKEQGKLDEAVARYRQALALKPGAAEIHNILGAALSEQGRLGDAVAHYERALALRPDYAEVHNNLGNALQAEGKLDEAVARYEQALALKPDFAEAHNNLGNRLREQGKLDEAVEQYRQALAIKPDFAEAHYDLGHALRELGRVAEARRAYEKAIELAPQKPRFYLSLCQLKQFAPGDAALAAMEKLASEAGSLSPEDRIDLGFALGKAYRDLGEHERAFRHLLEGNALKRQRIIYDEAATLTQFALIRKVFTPEMMREKRGLGDPSPAPVLIIGMPRSGTTLIEQILASHPRVFGAGELRAFADAVAKLSRPDGAPAPFPEAASSMGGEQLRQLGESYVGALWALARDAERITDKMPQNFYFAGLLHLALPNARIIHARRDPLDTCLSCFSQLFADYHPYSYDLGELGRYYWAYEGLMEHWRKVLPPDIMLEIQYEEVTADLEGQARRIVAHCGLEWDGACLAFHETKRLVRTASAVNVHQPIYRTSVGRARTYEHLLGPLIEALRAEPQGDPGAASSAPAHEVDRPPRAGAELTRSPHARG